MERIKLLLTLDVDLETGETVTVDRKVINDDLKPTKKSSSKKKDDDPVPKITLESNKYCLNAAAVELLGVSPDDRLDIKMEKQGKKFIPVIGTNETFGTKSGNRLTKSFTVSCRGKANEELSKYGEVFTLTPHPSKEGLFSLTGDKEPPVVEDAPDVTEDTTTEDINLEPADLEGLVDNDGDSTEISAGDFDFNL